MGLQTGQACQVLFGVFIVRFREAKKAEFEKSKLEREEAMSERKRTKDAEIEAERTQKELEKMYEKLQHFCQTLKLVIFGVFLG